MLYSVHDKHKPEVWDRGTQYTGPDLFICEKCGGSPQWEIFKLGAYLPNRDKTFGLIHPVGGIIGSEKSVQYLKQSGINEFTVEEAVVTFGKTNLITDEFYWIKPTKIVELDTDNGPGPVVVCQECGRRMWKEKNLTLPRLKDKVDSDLFQIKYTFTIIVTEKFIEVARKVPDGCYLEFEPWHYES
jgi:hypothetical protein